MAEVNPADAVIRKAVRERRNMQSGRDRLIGLLALTLLGALGLLTALVFTAGNPNAAPTCNGQTMSPTDTCEIIVTGTSPSDNTYTYQQMINRRNSSDQRWKIIGFCLTGLAVLLVVPVARACDPSKPWGREVGGACPKCGQKNLREKLVIFSRYRGRVTHSYKGIVTLCTAGCDFASVRRPPATVPSRGR